MTSSSTNTHLPLQSKIAVVTGATRGLGAGIALKLAKRGANIIVAYTSESSEQKADEVISKISSLGNGSQAVKVQANLREIDAPEKIIQATIAAFGSSVDILVTNAAVELVRHLSETTAGDFAYVFDINVRGAYLMAKAVEQYLRAPGRIINLSSVGGRCGLDKMTVYSASKAALKGMTRGLARELGAAGHTVNAISPRPVKTDMLDNIPMELVAMRKMQTAMERRLGTVDDIAQVVRWLAEEQSRWISGQTISASGGFLML